MTLRLVPPSEGTARYVCTSCGAAHDTRDQLDAHHAGNSWCRARRMVVHPHGGFNRIPIPPHIQAKLDAHKENDRG